MSALRGLSVSVIVSAAASAQQRRRCLSIGLRATAGPTGLRNGAVRDGQWPIELVQSRVPG